MVIDGVIDIERTKEWKFDAPDAKISADAVSLGLFSSLFFYYLFYCACVVGSVLELWWGWKGGIGGFRCRGLGLIGSVLFQIADAYWHLHTQPRTSFTHELDMRPYVEKW